MSVQAGIVSFDGAPIDRHLLIKISRDMSEFAPDDESIESGKDFAILYRPFHTTSESRTEKQPLPTRQGQILTWSGRLDNRDELVNELGTSCLGVLSSDVNIVGAAYERWGTDCFRRLIGDWALSIFDPTRKTAILARDCFGIAPLFYWRGEHQLRWCSHLSPLVLNGGRFHLNGEFIAGYIAFFPDPKLTPFREISSVPPGAFLTIDDHSIKSCVFWKLNPDNRTRYKTDTEYEEAYRFLFCQSVRRRLRTDSPILAGLSGGYDSTSIVCMADDIMTSESSECPRLDTFSYYDAKEPDDDDLLHIRAVESKRGRAGIHCNMDGSGDSLHLDEPNFSPVPGFSLRDEITPVLIATIRNGGYRVGLSGTGGDEMNGQPLDFRIQMAEMLRRWRVKQVAAQLVSWSLLTRRPWIQLFLQSLLELFPTSVRALIAERAQVDPWMNIQFARKYRMSRRQLEDVRTACLSGPAFRDAVQTLFSLSGQMTYTPPSLIENRYPYLDRQFVEFMTSIPLDQILRIGERRSLMRRALTDLLPPETASRKTKAAAVRCYCVTLEKHWEFVNRLFVAPMVCAFGICDQQRIVQALFEMRNGQVSPYFTRLLKALSLESWLRRVNASGFLCDPKNKLSRRGAGFGPISGAPPREPKEVVP